MMQVCMDDRKKTIRASKVVRKGARELRGEQTEAEDVLWERLRRRRLKGLKFRRQHPIGRFVVDFCCPDLRLIVEVDGEVHREQVEYDTVRTQTLEAKGYQVIRFTNEQVLTGLDIVVAQILYCAHFPSPTGGRGVARVSGPG